MKQEILLNRSDDRPVAFMGELLIDVTTRGDDPRNKKSRWHRLRIYETEDGWKLGLARITCWENERDHYWVLDTEDSNDITVAIYQHVTDREEADELMEMIKDQLKTIQKINKQPAASGEWKPRAK